MSDAEKVRFTLVDDVLPAWRADVEFIEVPLKPLPESKLVRQDPGPSSLVCELDAVQGGSCNGAHECLSSFAEEFRCGIGHCVEAIEGAESKRREISASAELLHGICDSHILSEQNLSVFVKSIDKILCYFDNFDRISLDFRSPMFTVLSPDFPLNVRKILKGIEFFEQNTAFKESRIMASKYRLLQKKSCELLKIHIEKSLATAVVTSKSNDLYSKFKLIAGPTKRLFALMDESTEFLDLINVYRSARVSVMKHRIAQVPKELPRFQDDLREFCDLVRKEYELSESFFSYDRSAQYMACFNCMVDDMAEVFCLSVSNLVYQTCDTQVLCQFVQPSNYDIPPETLGAEVIKYRLEKLAKTGQERLIFRLQLSYKEIAGSEDFIAFIHSLHTALPEKLCNECLCGLILEYMNMSKDRASELEGLSGSAFLLSRLLSLKREIDTYKGELVGVQKSGWSFFGIGSEVRIDLRRQVSSDILLAFQSIGSHATQFLMHPILNLKARGLSGLIQVRSAVEGGIVSIDTFYASDVSAKLKEYLSEDDYQTVLNSLKEQMILALGDCVASLGALPDEAMKLIDNLKARILALS